MSRHCRVLKFILVGLVCVSLLPVKVQAQKNTEFIRSRLRVVIACINAGTKEHSIYPRTSVE